MKIIYTILCFFLFASISYGQGKFLTKKGYASFYSDTILEEIKAENNQVLSIIDTDENTIAIVILMKSFMFEKSLMQEHFNENFVESDKYPKAIFKGKIKKSGTLSDEENHVTIEGDITIHGVTQKIEIIASLVKWKESIMIKADFLLAVSSFNIDIPTAVVNNIAKTVEVSFQSIYTPYKKKLKQ